MPYNSQIKIEPFYNSQINNFLFQIFFSGFESYCNAELLE